MYGEERAMRPEVSRLDFPVSGERWSASLHKERKDRMSGIMRLGFVEVRVNDFGMEMLLRRLPHMQLALERRQLDWEAQPPIVRAPRALPIIF
jgi:hypothetical protein